MIHFISCVSYTRTRVSSITCTCIFVLYCGYRFLAGYWIEECNGALVYFVNKLRKPLDDDLRLLHDPGEVVQHIDEHLVSEISQSVLQVVFHLQIKYFAAVLFDGGEESVFGLIHQGLLGLVRLVD